MRIFRVPLGAFLALRSTMTTLADGVMPLRLYRALIVNCVINAVGLGMEVNGAAIDYGAGRSLSFSHALGGTAAFCMATICLFLLWRHTPSAGKQAHQA